MALASGSTIGPYEITGPLGAGGMGEVYRARDTKLGRDVAIKVLPSAFAQDPDRRARFEREARVLASLNHPHIAVVHGLEEVPGESASALVMELVEGPTLAERLLEGPLPVEEALPIAKQIAAALEAAHEHGVVHRDLKPGNIKLRPDGGVKVLDFGLAKALSTDPTSGNLVHSPTLSVAATRQGYVLGTAAYMAPEQARGGTVDRSADLWAFGCVLYELLTGHQTFVGEDTTDVMAAVIKSEPDWSLLPGQTPQQIRTLLKQCLRKQRQQRLGDARAARLAIEEAMAEPLGGPATADVPVPAPRTAWQPAAAAAAATAAAATLVAWALWPAPARELAVEPERSVTRVLLDVAPAEQLTSVGGPRPASPAMAISPDGRTIVFMGVRRDGSGAAANLRIYRRRLDETVATPMQGTEGGVAPFFSPDGQWVAFFSVVDMQLKKAPVDGGPAVTIARMGPAAGVVTGASWGTNDTILYSSDPADGIFRVSADGGTPERVTTLDARTEWRHTVPHMLPGGRAMLYTAGIADGDTLGTRVMVYRFDTGETQLLLDNAADARFVATGHLLYMRRGTLMAEPFDPERLTLTGSAIAVLDGVMQAVGATSSTAETYHGQFQLAANGTLVYLSGGPFPPVRSELVWLDRSGAEEPVPNTPQGWGFNLRLAPDGTRLAMGVTAGEFYGQGDIWVYDIARSTPSRLTYGGTPSAPAWSPDGSELVYAKYFSNQLFRVRADGSGGTGARLSTGERGGFPATWSRADNVLVFFDFEPQNVPGSRVWTLPMDTAAEATLVKERANVNLQFFQFSPDGRWLAYSSNQTGSEEVYVEPYPGPGAAVRISTDGGHSPAWAGNELFYLRSANQKFQMMAVDVDTTGSLRVGAPQALFELPASVSQASVTNPLRSYDVAADGRRFIMSKLTSTPPDPVTQMHVVLNFAEELKRRVPVN